MADKREQNYYFKYLHRALSKVDADIPVPDSVRGTALRAHLDAVSPPVAEKKKGGSVTWLNSQGFGWRHGLSYAAAFAVIVTLAYGLRFNHPSAVLMDNGMEFSESSAASPEFAGFGIDLPEVAIEALDEDESAAEMALEGPRTGNRMAPEPDGNNASAVNTADGEPAMLLTEPDLYAVGGGSNTLLAAEFNGNTYIWRTNDPTDPDKAEYPITVDITGEDGITPIAQIDLPDMHTLNAYNFKGDRLAMMGAGDKNGGTTVLRLYNVQQPDAPEEIQAIVLKGEYVTSETHEGVVRIATYEPVLYDAIGVVMPQYSVDTGTCFIIALDIATGAYAEKTITGVGRDITLQGSNIVLSYLRKMADDPELQPGEDPALKVTEYITEIHLN